MKRTFRTSAIISAAILSLTFFSCKMVNGGTTNATDTEETYKFMSVKIVKDDSASTEYFLKCDSKKGNYPTDKLYTRAEKAEGDTTNEATGVYVAGEYTYTVVASFPATTDYEAEVLPSSTSPGSIFAGFFSENGKCFRDESTLAYVEKGYTYYARYNTTKSVKPSVGDFAVDVASPSATSVNYVTLDYPFANYSDRYDTVGSKVAGLVIYYGTVYTDQTTTDTDTALIMGLYGESGISWYLRDLPQENFDPVSPTNLYLDKADDKTGADNYSTITNPSNLSQLNLEVTNLEVFNWVSRYSMENEYTGLVSWYVPSAIEFETYLEKKLSSFISTINKAGGSISTSGGLWTSSIDQVRPTNYYACYYNMSIPGIHCNPATQDKSVFVLVQRKDP